MREKISSAGSLLKWLQWLGLGQTKVKSQHRLTLPHGYRAPHYFALPGASAVSWIRSGANETLTSAYMRRWHRRL